MRRVLAVLLALSIASACEARTAVMVDRNIQWSQTGIGRSLQKNIDDRTVALCTGFLSRFNPNGFDVIDLGSLRPNATGSGTEQLRTGVINGVTYTSVIYANYNGASLSTRAITTCWPCSLTYVAAHPIVPQLFIGAGTFETPFSNGNSASVRCSTGMVGDQGDPGTQAGVYGSVRTHLIGTPYSWPNFGMPHLDAVRATIAALNGTWRGVFINTRSCLESDLSTILPAGTSFCSFRDSLRYDDASCSTCDESGGDAIGPVLFVRYPVNNSYTASPIIFCRWQSHATTGRGGSVNPDHLTSVGGDPGVMYAAIALLDSLDGNRVLGTNKPDPIKVAFEVDGGGWPGTGGNYLGDFATGTSWRGGCEPSDTTNFYATLDSLTARKIKVTFGVDELQMAYGNSQRDAIKLKAMPYAHFTPQSAGVASASNMLRRANFRNPRDPFGYQRARGIFYSPGSADPSLALYAADSSLYALARGGFYLVDSIFGVGRRGTIAMPIHGDWVSSGLASSPNIDSLVFSLKAAGYSGLASDAQGDTLSTLTGYPAALGSGQRVRANRLGDGSPFVFLTYPGRSISALDSEAGFAMAGNDQNHSQVYAYFALLGLVLPQWQFDETLVQRTGENGTYGENGQIAAGQPGLFGGVSMLANEHTGVNLLRFSCAGLGSGSRQAGTSSADRPDYWTMVHLKNEFDAINTLAGRRLFDVVWDSEIGPRDIRR